ncbi:MULTISPECIES: hypothetical protein [Methanobacterium]|uniref:hypothetical protein n=1 Tax=Methanobacterium TaxID=2160 RepID=UPI00159F1859|nr:MULTISPECIES: hypothetical protein [Methanobacterium]
MSLLICPFLKWLEKEVSYNIGMLITLLGIFILGLGILAFLVATLSQLVQALPSLLIKSSNFCTIRKSNN